jgi:hypothetical protein
MSGAKPLLPIYVFIAWIRRTLYCTLIIIITIIIIIALCLGVLVVTM